MMKKILQETTYLLLQMSTKTVLTGNVQILVDFRLVDVQESPWFKNHIIIG